MDNRLHWIDCLKGFGILSVMVYHVPMGVFGLTSHSLINNLILLYFMPIFFLASGFLSYSLLTKPIDKSKWIKFSNYSLLFPFLIVGGLYCFLKDNLGSDVLTFNIIDGLFFQSMSSGYWFLLVLLFLRISSLFGRQLMQWIKLSNPFLIAIVIFIIMLVSSFVLWKYFSVLVMKQAFYYSFFYVIGMVLKLIENYSWVKLYGKYILFLGIFFSVLTIVFMLLNYELNDYLRFFLKIIPSLTVFGIFKTIDFQSYLGKKIEYWGTISLEIYIFHYFLFLGGKSDWIVSLNYEQWPLVFQLFVSLVLSLFFIVFSTFISKILRSNSLASVVFLGRK